MTSPDLPELKLLQRAIEHLGGTWVEPKGACTVPALQTYLDGVGTKHFSALELTSPAYLTLARRLGYEELLPPVTWWPRLGALVRLWEYVRLHTGPIRVKHLWRPADYNRAVKGAPSSDHLTAHAGDLYFRSEDDRERAESVLEELEATSSWLWLAIGRGKTMLHVGACNPRRRGHGRKARRWVY